MKKSLFTGLLCLTLSFSVQAKTFKIATVAPDGTTWMEALKDGAKEIKSRTEGRVKFRFYPGGIMGNDKAILRKMRIGQLHGGAITGGGLAAIYPDSQVYNLPLAFNDYEEVDYIRTKMDQQLIDGLKEKGYVSFGISEGGFAYVMSNSSVAGPKDLKGHKVWSPEGDDISRTAFESVGVSPIPLPLTDVLTGLQTGLIDTIASSTMGAVALQWHTKVKYVTNTPLMYLYGTMILKRKDFERLKPADQAIVQEVMGKAFAKLDTLNREDNKKAAEALKQQGITFITPTANEQHEWHQTVNKAIEKLLDKGVVSKTMAEDFYKHRETYRNGL